jgi:hypothetical protein
LSEVSCGSITSTAKKNVPHAQAALNAKPARLWQLDARFLGVTIDYCAKRL